MDEPFLHKLFAVDKARDLALAGLPEPQIEALIQMQYRGRMMSYASAFPAARSWIVERDGDPAGRLLEAATRSEFYIIDIAVAPAHRRRGVAEGLIHWLKTQTSGLNIAAQIYRENGASRALFAKLGFQEAATADDPQVRAVWRTLP